MISLITPVVPDYQATPTYLTVQTAAQQTGYCSQYLRRLLRAGRLKAIKVGQMWLIEADALTTYLEHIQGGSDRRCGPKQSVSTPVNTQTQHTSTNVYNPTGGLK